MADYTQSDRLVVAYAETVIRWRWIFLLISLALAVVAGAGARHTVFIADYTYYFGPENPQLAAFERVQGTYTKDDSVLFVIAPKTGDVFDRDVLEAVRSLTEQGWQVPYSIRVDSITNFQHTWSEGDDLVVEDLVEEPGGFSQEDLDRVREVALSEPLLVNRLVAANAGATAINVTVQLPDGESAEPEVTAFARGLVAEVETLYPDLHIALTGDVVMSNAFDEMARSDLSRLVPLMYLALVTAMFLFLRSAWGTLGTLLVTALATLTGMGLAGWAGIPITAISACAPTIIMTLAIANGVHILVTFGKGIRAGASKHEALVESMRLNWQPVFLTSLTTIIGFLSLNSSDVPPFNDLGNMTAVGVAAGWLFSVTTLPAFVAIVPYKVRPRRIIAGISMEAFADWMIAHRNRVLASTAGLLLVLAAFIPRIELNDMFVQYFDRSTEFRQDTDFTSEHLSGIYLIHYSLDAGEDEGINEPEYLAKLDEFAVWFRGQPEVNHISVLSDTMKRLNKNLHGDDPNFYRLPESREVAAQYLLLYEMSLPYGLDLNNQINVKKSSTKLTATLKEVSARELRDIEARAQGWLRANAPESMWGEGAGGVVMFSNISLRNIQSMASGTLLAFGLISLLLVVSFRSIRYGALSLIPNIVPTIMALGVWAILVGNVGMSVATVVAASLGIIVDATVHFLSKYLRARREQNASAEGAVRYAISMVGSALWVTFLILIIGFSVLALSPFKINSHFGLLVAITVGAALFADFLLLPTLLMRLDGRATPEDQERDVQPHLAGAPRPHAQARRDLDRAVETILERHGG